MHASLTRNRPRTLPGFTVVELLVASSIALIVMGAVTSLFGIFGRSVSDSQSIVDMNNRMRLAANRLRMDLGGATAPLRPPLDAESGAGYFEIVEGPQGDITLATETTPMRIVGDVDDRLAFTTRSPSAPFRGKYENSQIESDVAEVAWYCVASSNQPVPGLVLQTLYRRILLVAGYVGSSPFVVDGQVTNNRLAGASIPTVYNSYDLSLRAEAGALVPNTLTDLMRRDNRFFHGSFGTVFPAPGAGLYFDSASGREGEDVVLTNVIGFDVRVFDSEAAVRTSPVTSGPVFPGDPGYGSGIAMNPAVTGCFMDLGQGSAANGAKTVAGGSTKLSSAVAAKSRLNAPDGTATYDTWTTHYEMNGIDDDDGGAGPVDEGTDAVDNEPDGQVDESDELETAPPYSSAVKAVEIRIRCYDPASKQIRQVTVRHGFQE